MLYKEERGKAWLPSPSAARVALCPQRRAGWPEVRSGKSGHKGEQPHSNSRIKPKPCSRVPSLVTISPFKASKRAIAPLQFGDGWVKIEMVFVNPVELKDED